MAMAQGDLFAAVDSRKEIADAALHALRVARAALPDAQWDALVLEVGRCMDERDFPKVEAEST